MVTVARDMSHVMLVRSEEIENNLELRLSMPSSSSPCHVTGDSAHHPSWPVGARGQRAPSQLASWGHGTSRTTSAGQLGTARTTSTGQLGPGDSSNYLSWPAWDSSNYLNWPAGARGQLELPQLASLGQLELPQLASWGHGTARTTSAGQLGTARPAISDGVRSTKRSNRC